MSTPFGWSKLDLVNPALRRAFRFHLEHSGYRTPPGRAACALSLARAELRLRDMIAAEMARVVWEHEEEYYTLEDLRGCDCPKSDPCRHCRQLKADLDSGALEVLCCRIERKCPKCGQWEHATSLGMIEVKGLGDPYCRTVEAELASELGD